MQLTSSLLWSTAIATVGVAAPLLFILTHVFQTGGPDKNDPKYNEFVYGVSGGKKFLRSIFNIGFVKASVRRFFSDYKLLLFPQPFAVAAAHLHTPTRVRAATAPRHSALQQCAANNVISE